MPSSPHIHALLYLAAVAKTHAALRKKRVPDGKGGVVNGLKDRGELLENTGSCMVRPPQPMPVDVYCCHHLCRCRCYCTLWHAQPCPILCTAPVAVAKSVVTQRERMVPDGKGGFMNGLQAKGEPLEKRGFACCNSHCQCLYMDTIVITHADARYACLVLYNTIIHCIAPAAAAKGLATKGLATKGLATLRKRRV